MCSVPHDFLPQEAKVQQPGKIPGGIAQCPATQRFPCPVVTHQTVRQQCSLPRNQNHALPPEVSKLGAVARYGDGSPIRSYRGVGPRLVRIDGPNSEVLVLENPRGGPCSSWCKCQATAQKRDPVSAVTASTHQEESGFGPHCHLFPRIRNSATLEPYVSLQPEVFATGCKASARNLCLNSPGAFPCPNYPTFPNASPFDGTIFPQQSTCCCEPFSRASALEGEGQQEKVSLIRKSFLAQPDQR